MAGETNYDMMSERRAPDWRHPEPHDNGPWGNIARGIERRRQRLEHEAATGIARGEDPFEWGNPSQSNPSAFGSDADKAKGKPKASPPPPPPPPPEASKDFGDGSRWEDL